MKKGLINIFAVLVIQFLAPQSRAQYFDFSFEHLTTDDGLSSDVINSIVRDKIGFMWFGTADGLNRYDGRAFQVLKHSPADTNSLPSNNVGAIAVDPDGFFWITTGRGICKFDPLSFRFYKVDFPGNSRNTLEPYSNVAMGDGDFVWFISGDFLYKMNRKKQGYLRFKLPSRESYFSVHIDQKKRIWVFLRNALYLFNENNAEFRYYAGLSSLHPNEKLLVGQPVQTSSDTLLFTTYGHGFYFLDEKSDRLVKYKSSKHLLSSAIEDFTIDGKRFFWCLGGVTGLMIYDPVKDEFIEQSNQPRDPNSHNATECQSIYKEPASETVWIGTRAGIEKYDPFSLRFKRKFLSENVNFNSFSQLGRLVKDKTDRSGNTYWISSWALGVVKWDRATDKFNVLTQKDGLLSNEVFDVIQSTDGNILAASRDGVNVIDPRTGRIIGTIKDFMNYPISRKILRLMEDSDGNLWMAANYDGLFKYDRVTKKVQRIPLQGVDGGSGPYLLGSVDEDRHKRIWASGFLGNIYIITPSTGEIRTISSDQAGLPGLVSSLVVGSSGKIWVSGVGNYLAELNASGKATRIIFENAQRDGNGYNFLVEDNAGYIWASADGYIQRIDPDTNIRDRFSKEDGLISNSNIHDVSFTEDGELFLGFQYSLSYINTNNIPFNTRPPRVALSSSKIDYHDNNFGLQERIILGPKDRVLNLEFAALNYSQPAHNRFAYLMEGYDTAWVYNNDHDITLMNLEGGKHKLHVKAANNDGFWGAPFTLLIEVTPPFHQTIWFKLLLAVLLGVLAYLIYWSKKEQRKKLERVRQRIATDLHDDMGSTLSSIRIFSDVAKKQVEKVNPETMLLLDRISSNATSLSENMQDIIWTIRNDNDSLEDLVARMREFGLRVCDARQIHFNVNVSQNFRASKLNIEQRRNLYLIYKEVINNAVKYSKCEHIELFLSQKGRYLKMVISDDGVGFNLEQVKKGNGLGNIEKRAKEINGTLEVRTAAGEGTEVSVMMVLKKVGIVE